MRSWGGVGVDVGMMLVVVAMVRRGEVRVGVEVVWKL